eukprot:2437705-Amphidinium_carterae.1
MKKWGRTHASEQHLEGNASAVFLGRLLQKRCLDRTKPECIEVSQRIVQTARDQNMDKVYSVGAVQRLAISLNSLVW